MFNTDNLYFGSNGRPGLSNATAARTFMQASSLYGPVSVRQWDVRSPPMFGARFDF